MPNVRIRLPDGRVVDTAPEIQGLAEFDWVGKNLRIGEVELRIELME